MGDGIDPNETQESLSAAERALGFVLNPSQIRKRLIEVKVTHQTVSLKERSCRAQISKPF